jgi:hypothetical protein
MPRLLRHGGGSLQGAHGPDRDRLLRRVGAALVAGRGFDSRDLEKDAGTIIVNTTFAQRAFGSTNPIGRRVRQATSDRAPVGPGSKSSASSGTWVFTH